MPPKTPGRDDAGMSEFGVEAEDADNQQDEKRVGRDDAGEKFLARGQFEFQR